MTCCFSRQRDDSSRGVARVFRLRVLWGASTDFFGAMVEVKMKDRTGSQIRCGVISNIYGTARDELMGQKIQHTPFLFVVYRRCLTDVPEVKQLHNGLDPTFCKKLT